MEKDPIFPLFFPPSGLGQNVFPSLHKGKYRSAKEPDSCKVL